MNLRKLHEEITIEIANGLHYMEQSNYIDSLMTAAEVRAAVEGGVERYYTDPRFAAKVKKLVAGVMLRVSAEVNNGSNPPR